MTAFNKAVRILNGGSSSIMFAVYKLGEPLKRELYGHIGRIGLPGTILTFTGLGTQQPSDHVVDATDYSSAVNFLIEWLEKQPVFLSVKYDPDHLPGDIALIDAIQKRHPALTQIACFDTAFHRTMPRVTCGSTPAYSPVGRRAGHPALRLS